MTIEVRQMIVNSTVTRTRNEVRDDRDDVAAQLAIMEELVEECLRRIEEVRNEREER